MSDETGSALDAVDEGPQPSDVGGETGPSPSDPRRSSHPTVVALAERFGEALLRYEVQAGDEHVVFLDPPRNVEILRWLKEDPAQAYDLLRDVTGVDYGGGRPLQVVWILWSIPYRLGLRVKCEVPVADPRIGSVVPLWNAANWLEREVYDLFGVTFEGHPDLRRIMMPDDYEEGHPLRKDFPLRGRFSRAEQTRRALNQDPEHYYIAAEMGEGRDPQVLAAAEAPAPITGDEGDPTRTEAR
ncbi:MAG TPA: NADH-quinone oxidoreductase subunit C [Longimicrobiales bacterium]|jgi:NADH-quinone oxidoreductase subunit C